MSVLLMSVFWCFETPLWPTCGRGEGGAPSPLVFGLLGTKLDTNTLQGGIPTVPPSGPHSQARAGVFGPQKGMTLAPPFIS